MVLEANLHDEHGEFLLDVLLPLLHLLQQRVQLLRVHVIAHLHDHVAHVLQLLAQRLHPLLSHPGGGSSFSKLAGSAHFFLQQQLLALANLPGL